MLNTDIVERKSWRVMKYDSKEERIRKKDVHIHDECCAVSARDVATRHQLSMLLFYGFGGGVSFGVKRRITHLRTASGCRE